MNYFFLATWAASEENNRVCGGVEGGKTLKEESVLALF